MKRLLLAVVALMLGEAAWAKAPLKPLYCYRFTELDANGGLQAAENSGTGACSLATRPYGDYTFVPALRDGEGRPVVGKFGAYSVFADGWSGNCSSFRVEGDESTGLGCSSGTGFAISLWFRPTENTRAWSDFFAFRLGDVAYDFEYNDQGGFSVYDFATSEQAIRDRHNASAQISAPIKANDWNHLCLVWKPYAAWRDWKHYGELWLNGAKVGIFLPNVNDVAKDNCVLRALYLGAVLQKGTAEGIGDYVTESPMTGIGDVAVYGSSISDDDVAYLYTHAPGPLPRGREMTVGLHFDRSWKNDGGDSPTAFVNSGTLQLPLSGDPQFATEGEGACGSGFGFSVKGSWKGNWFEGDETTGLGASTATGLTLSYWTRTTSSSKAWADILGVGFDDTTDFFLELTDNQGGSAIYGHCELQGLTQTNEAWHHHALVLEPGSTTFRHWQDGEENGTMAFKDALTSGLLRRLCIGPMVKYEGGWRCNNEGDTKAGLDEVAVYNYAMTADEIAWLGTHEAALPPLAVTTLARTVSADGTWGGMSADWTLNGTDRKLVYPSGEDAEATVSVTVAGDAQLSVDTLVRAKKVVFGGTGTLTLAVDEGCAFAPEAVSGSCTLVGLAKFAGTWVIDALDGASAAYLSWPADMDFSETTINVAVEAGRRGEYPLVENFTGRLPKKVLHQGKDDGTFKAVVAANGTLILRNRAACGMVIVLK